MSRGGVDWPLTGTLTVAMASSTVLAYAFGALGPFLTTDLDLSRAQLGALTTVLYAVGAALSPSSGAVVDRFGGRVVLLGLFAAGGLAALGGAAAPGYGLLLVAAGIGGVSVALGNPSTNALLAVHVDPRHQGVATGVKQSGVQLGAFLAGAVLPVVAGALGWRGALAASAALAVGGGVATAVAVPAAPSPPASAVAAPVTGGRAAGARARAAGADDSGRDGAGGAGPDSRGAAAASGAPVLGDRAVTQLAVYAFLMGVGVGAVGAYLPLYAVERLGLSTAVAGLAAGLIGLTGVVARIVWGRAADRRPAAGVASLGPLAAGSVLAVVLLAGAEPAWAGLVWPAALLFGATAVAWNAVGMLAVVRGVDAARSGRASGRVLLGFYLGFVVAPTAFGGSVDATGSYLPGWGVLAATFGVAAALSSRWRRLG